MRSGKIQLISTFPPRLAGTLFRDVLAVPAESESESDREFGFESLKEDRCDGNGDMGDKGSEEDEEDEEDEEEDEEDDDDEDDEDDDEDDKLE